MHRTATRLTQFTILDRIDDMSESFSIASVPRIEARDGVLRVWLDAGDDGYVDLHHRFLRHHAGTDRHPKTGERTLCSSELADDVAPTDARVDAASGDLVVTWDGGATVARYTPAWLREVAYGRVDPGVAPPPSDAARFTVDAEAIGDLRAVVAEALARVRRDGLVIVRGGARRPTPVEATEPLIEAFLAAGLTVRETHFGRIEDLRPDNTTNANNDQLGYTDAPIDLHTDQPFIDDPPRFQLLQGVVPATEGGENAFVDAFLAARWLRAHEEADHALLATTPVRLHRKQKAFESIVDAPTLYYPGGWDDPAGFRVRYSYFTLAPFRVPFARMAAFYRAFDRFARLVRDPRNQVVARLEAGDFVLYDNHRVLHARKPFRGPRWVRGIYFDEGAVTAR